MKKPIYYREPDYYRKQGRRYVQIATWERPFEPAEGIWLVLQGSYRLIQRLGEYPTVSVAAAFARHKDAICAAIQGQPKHGEGSSVADLADAIWRAVAKAEAGGR